MPGTIMMIHGMWGGAFVWDDFRTYFEARGWTVRTPALRHHDAPPELPPPELGETSIADYVADLEAEIVSLPAPPVLIGHCLGGLLAQILAARGLIRGAVLLAPAAPAGIVAISPSVARALLPMLLRPGFWRRPFRPGLAEASYAILNALPPARQRSEHARFRHESGRVLKELLLWQPPARVDERAVNCPLLILAGRRDRITPTAVVRRIARKYGREVSYKELPDHAHWLMGEDGWPVIAAGIADWLQRIEPRSLPAT